MDSQAHKPIRIALTGAHSTGKTSLLQAFQQDSIYRTRFVFLAEITRQLQQQGLAINEQGDSDTQCAIMAEHLKRFNLPHDTFVDRCTLDGLVYTQYLEQQGRISPAAMTFAENIYQHTIWQYNYLFYTDSSIPLQSDGIRSSSQEFRNNIILLFKKQIEKDKLPIIVVRGTIQERVDFIKEILQNEF